MSIWMTARGAGLSALVLLTLSTCLGALGSRRSGAGGRVVLQYLHRTAGALGLGVLALHIATILADSYAHVGVIGAVVPFTSSYRATWVGLGTIAGYCLIAVAALGFARGRMAVSPAGARIWRSLHCLAYASWGFAMVHGFESGTDSGVTWVRGLYLLCLLAVLGSVAVRVAGLAGREQPRRDLAAARPPISAGPAGSAGASVRTLALTR